jgi:hypothetical protein
MRTADGIPSARWWQPWTAFALFAFLLNFAWEMLQFPLFAGMARAPHAAATAACLRATLGDVAITLVACGAGAVAARSQQWIIVSARTPAAVYLAVALLLAIAAEVVNLHLLRRWAYSAAMPTLLGIGLVPILQWLTVPPLVLWLARRHLGST